MRAVVLILVALIVPAMMPTTHAADDCAAPGVGSFCQRVALAHPGSPVPSAPIYGLYYLWIGAGHCLPPSVASNDCRGYPADDDSGIYYPTPTGAWARLDGPEVFGVLYQESNGLYGLQRAKQGSYDADRMVVA